MSETKLQENIMEISFVFQDMLRDGQILDYRAIGEKLLKNTYSQAAYVHETIVDLAKEFENLWNEEEGDYFTDIQEFAKDRLSRIFSAREADNPSGITKEDIANGITDGIVRFIVDPNLEEGTVCEIGENWFYFGGQTAEEENPDDYLAHTSMSDIVREIFETLESIKDLDNLEYQYYEAIFREAGSRHKAEPFPITRKMTESHERHVSQIISRVNGYIIRAKELEKHECLFPCDRNKEEDAPFYEDVKKRFVRAGYSFRIDTENHGVQKIMW